MKEEKPGIVRETALAPYGAGARVAVEPPPIEEIVATIVRGVHPRRVVLFGSRASGTQRPDSDVDLMVEWETPLGRAARAVAIGRLFGLIGWPLDLFIYTPAEVAARRDTVGDIVHTIEHTGRVLHG